MLLTCQNPKCNKKQFESIDERKTCSRRCNLALARLTNTKLPNGKYVTWEERTCQCGTKFIPAALHVKSCKPSCGYQQRSVEWKKPPRYTKCQLKGCEELVLVKNGISNKGCCEEHSTLIREQSLLNKYGVTNTFHSEKIQEKVKQKLVENYGVEYPSQSSVIQERKRQHNLQKYGVDHPMKVKENREKANDTIFKKHGVRNSTYIHIPKETLDIFLNEEKLREIYCGRQLSYAELASQYKVSIGFVAKWLKQFNIPIERPHTSQGERDLAAYIKELLPTALVQCNIQTVLPYEQEIDVYLPEYKIGFEYNGVYWHTEKISGKGHQVRKTKLADRLKVHLIQVYEDEWLLKQEVVKRKIKEIFNPSPLEYGTATVIFKKQASEFFIKHGLEKFQKADKYIGLFETGEMIGGMSVKGNHIIQIETLKGGEKTLLDYYMTKYKPLELTIELPREWFTSKKENLTSRLGFKLVGEIESRFNYVANNVRVTFSDLSLRFVNPKYTDYQNALQNGYDRIWGCGSLKYLWQR